MFQIFIKGIGFITTENETGNFYFRKVFTALKIRI